MGKKSKSRKIVPGSNDNPANRRPGTVPNLYWGAVDMEDMRRSRAILALPSEDQVAAAHGWQTHGATISRFVRQGTPLWNDLHAGMLTTGSLRDALGFKEERAARIVGGAGMQAGHGHMVRAYHNLRQNPHPALAQPHSCAPASAKNVRTVPKQGEADRECGDSSSDSAVGKEAGSVSAVCDDVPSPTNDNQVDSSDLHWHALVGYLSEAVAAANIAPPSPAPGREADGEEAARKLRVCTHVANMGIGEVRMRFGLTQEASALYGLHALMPHSLLLEVGLLTLDHTQLPSHWGFEQGTLPPLGASPDALIAHPLACPEQVLWDAELARGTHGGSQHSSFVAGLTTPREASSAASASATGSGAGAGVGNGVGSSSSQWQTPGRGYVASQGHVGGRVDPPELQATYMRLHGALREMLVSQVHVTSTAGASRGGGSEEGGSEEGGSEEGGSEVEGSEVEGSEVEGSEVEGSAEEQGVLDSEDEDEERDEVEGSGGEGLEGEGGGSRSQGQSYSTGGDTLAEHITPPSEAAAQLTGLGPTVAVPLLLSRTAVVPLSDLAQQPTVTRTDHHTTTEGPPAAAAGCTAATQSTPAITTPTNTNTNTNTTQAAGVPAVVVEVVEVKTTVPFSLEQKRSGARGRVRTQFCIRDRGPRDRVAAHWVPQLQMHMLTAGTRSGLLVSRSLTRGVRVFRMWRDDEYCYRMLRVVSRLFTEHVRRGREPPPNAFSGDPLYQSLLEHSKRLARSAEEVAWSPTTPIPPGADDRALV